MKKQPYLRDLARLATIIGVYTALAFVGDRAALALPYVPGQVFASVGLDRVNVFNPNGTLSQTLNTFQGSDFTAGSAFDASGNFYVTNFITNTITKFDSNGALLNSFGDTNPSALSPESIVFSKAGDLYVGYADGDRDIRKYSAAGALLAQYNAAPENQGTDWIDLAGDQKTMFYTSEGRLIKRFDVVNNIQLADFTTLPGDGTAFTLRLLPDGGLIVADFVNVKRLNSSGAVVQTYDVPGEDQFFVLNLDPDQTTVWAGGQSSSQIYRFNLATGDVIISFNSQPFVLLAGLSIFGQAPSPPQVPEPSTVVLFMTGLGGLLYYKRRSKVAA